MIFFFRKFYNDRDNMTKNIFDPVFVISEELALTAQQVRRVFALFDEGNTIPFIARYRKESTGNLDEVQIRAIQEKIRKLEPEERMDRYRCSEADFGRLYFPLKYLREVKEEFEHSLALLQE